MIKEEYRRQIHTWALTNANSRRKLLVGLLKCQPRADGPATARAATGDFDATRHCPELVQRTVTARIDFNQTFMAITFCRRPNLRRFASPGCDDVFHCQPLPALPPLDLSTRSPHRSTLADFHVKKFMTVAAADQVLPVARHYLDILQDVRN
jgi:hypothetical protein